MEAGKKGLFFSGTSGRQARGEVEIVPEAVEATLDLEFGRGLTLSGRVLPIGGVKEKVLGAVRAGIDTVVLPAENEADLEDLPEEIRKGLTIHLVSELGEALAHALRGGEYREGKLRFSTTPDEAGGSTKPLRH